MCGTQLTEGSSMISPDHAQLMANYNQWQNGSIYGAAATLSDEERRRDRGAFFKSIHGTLNHLLWGDQTWMNRLAGMPPPGVGSADTADYYDDWSKLLQERKACDASILDWTSGLSQSWLSEDLTWYSGSAGRELSKPKWLLMTHFFNHQTHHRGQVHAMLTQAGAKPEDTDIIVMP